MSLRRSRRFLQPSELAPPLNAANCLSSREITGYKLLAGYQGYRRHSSKSKLASGRKAERNESFSITAESECVFDYNQRKCIFKAASAMARLLSSETLVQACNNYCPPPDQSQSSPAAIDAHKSCSRRGEEKINTEEGGRKETLPFQSSPHHQRRGGGGGGRSRRAAPPH